MLKTKSDNHIYNPAAFSHMQLLLFIKLLLYKKKAILAT